MSYFECNLPDVSPAYIHPTMSAAFTETLQRVKRRMAKLDDALEMTGMDGAVFAKLAKVLFDNFYTKFEDCGAEELAVWVQSCDDGSPVQHRLEWPNATVVVDCAFLTTEEWEMIRHLGIGGSDDASILGTSIYKNAQETYHDKVWSPMLMPADESQAIFDRGHFMEDNVVEAFLRLTDFKRIPETRMFRSKKYPHALADIDAIIQAPDGRLFVFEVKTTVAENYAAWEDDKIPRSYVPQIRHYPAVLADDRIQGTYIGCIFVVDLIAGGLYIGSSFSDEQFVARFLDRNIQAEGQQLQHIEEWWNAYVERGIEPPPSSIPSNDIAVIRQFHSGPANPDKPVLDLTPEASQYWKIIEEYVKVADDKSAQQKVVKSLEDRQKQIQKVFMKRMLDVTEARIDLPSGNEYYEIKWIPRKGTTVDTEKLKIAFPEAYQRCVETNPESSRVFSIKKKVKKATKKKKP